MEEPPTRTNERRHPPERNLHLTPAVEAPRQRPHRQPQEDGPPQANPGVEPALPAYRHVPRRNQPRRQRNTDQNLLLVEGRVEPTSGKHWQPILSCVISGIFVFAAVVLGVVFGIVVPARNGNQSIAPFSSPTPSWAPTSSQYPTKTPSLSPSAAPTSRTYDAFVDEISKDFGQSTYIALTDSASPQSKAARWLIEQDEVSASLSLDVAVDRFQIRQRFVLAVLFFATGGDVSWIDTFEFLNPYLHECSWGFPLLCTTECDAVLEFGFTMPSDGCDNTTGRVNVFSMFSFNNMVGTLPPELGVLTDLIQFGLSYNNVGGTLPEEIFGITNMLVFVINDSKLSGTLSSSIQNWTNLKSFASATNLMTGTLPSEIQLLQSLEALYLPANYFSGSVPTKWGEDLHLLRELWLSGNLLTGTIPTSFVHLSNLEELRIDRNGLTGTFPSNLLRSLTNMRVLLLELNELTGSLPSSDWLETPNITWLSTGYNTFNGSIPTELGSLLKLTNMFLGNNLFTGTIPSEVGNLVGLNVFAIEYNMLTGTIPSELGNLILVESMTVANNWLTGTIPTALGNLVNTTLMYLHNNFLTGKIPSEIGNLVRLRTLGMLVNGLTGTIPTELGQLVSLKTISLEGNYFSGTIPSELGHLVNLVLMGIGPNSRLSGTLPSTFDRMEPFHIYLHATNLTGNTSVICDRYIPADLWADCARLECPCCTLCVNGTYNESTP